MSGKEDEERAVAQSEVVQHVGDVGESQLFSELVIKTQGVGWSGISWKSARFQLTNTNYPELDICWFTRSHCCLHCASRSVCPTSRIVRPPSLVRDISNDFDLCRRTA